uniref:Apolipoprotein L domain containing 1a n=1 Tax=Amphiprion percula TaxID=161767 RepID=A0A3P8TYU7_AMPPE
MFLVHGDNNLLFPPQSSEKLPLVQETVELQDLNLPQVIYMAARLFVRLFNQRGASLQQRILELVALADAADQFHKKTVTAAVGGGVASVAGSVATITGLILAPFTFGASIIVTAVGISVATAGSITSATANITDTVHSNMDRKKVEKMIQGYEEEIKDIRECMEFVQVRKCMDTLEEWDFSKYSESAAKKALNHNIKHVMKEGGRAGKALMINTDKLISTVQVLGAAGGVAKAAQAISVTTGVMSALFLALDVFFLAKDSHKLRKGAKTKFAAKIREVCKDLQDGLLELNKVKTQLQKTMDGCYHITESSVKAINTVFLWVFFLIFCTVCFVQWINILTRQ